MPSKLDLTTTQDGSIIPNSFLYWYKCLFYVGDHPQGNLHHKSSYKGVESAVGWLVWVQARSSSDFCLDWFQRAQNITEYIINLDIRKFLATAETYEKVAL